MSLPAGSFEISPVLFHSAHTGGNESKILRSVLKDWHHLVKQTYSKAEVSLLWGSNASLQDIKLHHLQTCPVFKVMLTLLRIYLGISFLFEEKNSDLIKLAGANLHQIIECEYLY